MQMKTTYMKYSILAALALMLCACVEETIEKGAPDMDGCMGVYFVEEQENIKAHVFDKDEDDPSLEFVVRRADASKAVEIPLEYSVYRIVQTMGDTAYVEAPLYDLDKFKFDKKITFAKDQRETKVKVSFEGITTGQEFTCTMSISDPQYVSMYSGNPAAISFTVQMNEWKKISGNAIYRDALFSDVFAWNGQYLQNSEVEVYERKDKKHYYKFKGLYSPSFLVRLMEGEEEYAKNKVELENQYERYFDKDATVELDATDSTKVFFPLQKIGFTHPTYGETYIASDVAEVFGTGSNLLYGTRSEEGIITFPKNGVLIGLGGLLYFSNTSGKFRIALPGADAKDYEIGISNEETENGEVPFKFTVSEDVKKIKYAVFQGKINGVAMADSVAKVEASGTEVIISEGETSVEKKVCPADPKTGLYTLVACTYGEGDTKYREFASLEFGYVKAGEESGNKVQITMGLHTDDQFASDKEEENYSSENSFQYWIRGKGITNAVISYYPTSYFNTYREKIEESLTSGYSQMDGATLKVLNSTGLSGILGNRLDANTEYTMIVYAENEYYGEFFTKTITTSGETDYVQKTYYAADIEDFTQPATESYQDTWIPVSIDIFDAEATGRTIRGNWRAKEVTLSVEGDVVTATGLFPALKTNPSIKFDLKDGFLYTRENRGAKVMVKDSTHLVPSMRFEYQYIPKTTAVTGDGSVFENFDDKDTKERRDMMMGGFVHEDVIAFVDNRTDYQFWALTMGGYQKNMMGEEILSSVIGDAHGQLLLVRKSNTELLKSLVAKESEGQKDENALSSAAEAHTIVSPKKDGPFGEHIKVDTEDKLVEFRNDARIKCNIDNNNLR